jgi:hypothetical protein
MYTTTNSPVAVFWMASFSFEVIVSPLSTFSTAKVKSPSATSSPCASVVSLAVVGVVDDDRDDEEEDDEDSDEDEESDEDEKPVVGVSRMKKAKTRRAMRISSNAPTTLP